MVKFDEKTELRIQQAIKAIAVDPSLKASKAAKLFNVAQSQLYRRLQGQGSLKGRQVSHTKLSAHQEAAICSYIDRLDHMSLRVRKELVRPLGCSLY